MLILTRRIKESICIGDQIKVTVLSIRGNQVSIGIKAPRQVPVHREEIFERIKGDDGSASESMESATIVTLESRLHPQIP